MKNHIPSFRAGEAGKAAGFTFAKLILFLLIFSGVITAAWVYFLPVVLTSALQKHTGFAVKVGQLQFNPFTARVDLSGLVVENPESFPRRDFLKVASFQANARLATLFSDRPEFDYVRLEVAEVALVRDADGVINSRLFRERLDRKPTAQQPPLDSVLTDTKPQPAEDKPADRGGEVARPQAEKGGEAKAPVGGGGDQTADAAGKDKKGVAGVAFEPPLDFLIDRLELKLDRLVVADYAGATPQIHEYNCNLNYTFNHVTDPKQVVGPFALKCLRPAGVAIRALIPGGVGRSAAAVTQSPEPLFRSKTDPAADPMKTLVQKLEDSRKP